VSAKKKIPKHRSEDAERKFWAAEDSTAYVDWRGARRSAFPDLKPSLKTISLRLPEMMLAELKALANKRDVPYQSLLKMFLAERIAAELQALTRDEDGNWSSKPVPCRLGRLPRGCGAVIGGRTDGSAW
jgi:predicted DNA binding CopG/RHH family protein